jgi:hypothetical protein
MCKLLAVKNAPPFEHNEERSKNKHDQNKSRLPSSIQYIFRSQVMSWPTKYHHHSQSMNLQKKKKKEEAKSVRQRG